MKAFKLLGISLAIGALSFAPVTEIMAQTNTQQQASQMKTLAPAHAEALLNVMGSFYFFTSSFSPEQTVQFYNALTDYTKASAALTSSKRSKLTISRANSLMDSLDNRLISSLTSKQKQFLQKEKADNYSELDEKESLIFAVTFSPRQAAIATNILILKKKIKAKRGISLQQEKKFNSNFSAANENYETLESSFSDDQNTLLNHFINAKNAYASQYGYSDLNSISGIKKLIKNIAPRAAIKQFDTVKNIAEGVANYQAEFTQKQKRVFASSVKNALASNISLIPFNESSKAKARALSLKTQLQVDLEDTYSPYQKLLLQKHENNSDQEATFKDLTLKKKLKFLASADVPQLSMLQSIGELNNKITNGQGITAEQYTSALDHTQKANQDFKNYWQLLSGKEKNYFNQVAVGKVNFIKNMETMSPISVLYTVSKYGNAQKPTLNLKEQRELQNFVPPIKPDNMPRADW